MRISAASRWDRRASSRPSPSDRLAALPMKAVRFHQHGGVDVLRYDDAPEPEVLPGEVLVRVRACALNHLDIWGRRGLPGVTIPMPHICGSDIAGEVVKSAAVDVPIGRRVLLQPGM